MLEGGAGGEGVRRDLKNTGRMDPTDSLWGALLGANAMAAANKQARVTIWKDFMVAGWCML